MKITIEDYELIYSGIAIQIKNYPIKVILSDEIEGDFTFIFSFIKNSDTKVATVLLNPIDRFTLALDFVNFENQLSLASTDIIHLGSLKNRQLYFSYRVLMHQNTGNTLIFNFYTRKEIKNG